MKDRFYLFRGSGVSQTRGAEEGTRILSISNDMEYKVSYF